ncbi:MAG: HAMP domain-containing histidine kinase [Clostridia bacterium]|nr:HAMP domain-containing histidine kinase [Clostridia bacterium]
MINKIKAFAKRCVWSLRTRMALVVLLGAVLGTLAYVFARLVMMTAIDGYIATDEARLEREGEYVERLQNYITQNELSSEQTPLIAEWVKHNNRHTYVMVYKDNELLFSSDVTEEEGDGSKPTVPGITVEYPTLEEIRDYATQNDMHSLEVSDGIIFAQVSDFTEYFYYDAVNVVSLIIAFLVLAAVMMIYFFRITGRLASLSRDVNIVSGINMNHTISQGGSDELSDLAGNVEQMRSSIIMSIEKEREAHEANAELITSMSHDIRTPLTVLLGYIDLMKSRECDEVMQGYIRATETTALRLKELSDDMFRYFLVFGGKEIEADIQSYDARTLLEQLLSEHILLLDERGYTLKYSGDEDFPDGARIYTDAPRLMRIIDNLFSNIYKYADAQCPIELKITITDGTLSITLANKISKRIDRTESSGIGLKTCGKIAEAIDAILNISESEDIFTAELLLKLNKGDGNAELS